MEQKLSFLQLLASRTSTMAEACRAFRICRQSGYKWWRRYQRGGVAGLQELSRRPRRSPQAAGAVWLERLRLARRRHRRWGPKKLRVWLQKQQPRARVPSVSTLGRLLRRQRWSEPQLGRRRGPDRAWPALRLARHPNDVWTVDFKGYFHTADVGHCTFLVSVLDPTPAPLAIIRQGMDMVELCWDVTCTTDVLEESPTLGLFPPANWTAVNAPVTIASGRYKVTLPIMNGNRFFRVRRQ